MLKKRGLLIVVVLGLMVLGTGVAYAASDQPPQKLRAAGRIKEIDLAAGTFTMETMRKGEIIVVVSESTQFRSRGNGVQGLEDLEPGMRLIVAGDADSKGQLLADIIATGKLVNRQERLGLGGEITGIATSDSSFTLKTRDGTEREIHVSDRTRFISRNDDIQGIDDLEIGTICRVRGVNGPDGQLNASVVAAGSPEDRPDIRAVGEITAIGDGSFTLESRQGRSLVLAVDGSTRFLSRDGHVTGLDDLQVGMRAAVAAEGAEDGTYKAIVVWVGTAEQRPESGLPSTPAALPEA